jgi:hypothetical protein
LDIFLYGFSLSSCTQHNLKVFMSLLLLNAMCLLNYVLNCKQNLFGFRMSIRINCNRISEGLL